MSSEDGWKTLVYIERPKMVDPESEEGKKLYARHMLEVIIKGCKDNDELASELAGLLKPFMNS